MMKLIPFIIYILLISFHQVMLGDALAIYTARVDLSGLLVLMIAMYKPELVAAWFGFFAGLVVAAATPSASGWHALILGALGWTAFHVRQRLNIESPYARILVVLIGVLVHNALALVLSGSQQFLYSIAVNALPGSVYTTLLAGVVFLIADRRITYEKVKALF
ncbi:MAG TPA: rod shape-determining protein MreD [Candidatus Deferrimicrobium sp.]|nr:rod shape-determining protein MreD [Candidatus Deferrimicrobium sp.]